MKRKLYVAVWGMSLLTACSAPKTGAPEWFENAVKHPIISCSIWLNN